MLSFSRLSIKSLLLAAAFTATGIASASPIAGSFSLNGFGGSYIGGTATTATGLDFGAASGGVGNGYGTNGTAFVGNATGSFAGLTNASVSDIALSGNTANPYQVNPFISFGGSLITVNFSNAVVTRSTTGTSVTIAGLATFSDGTAADATNGTFSLSANSQNGTASDVNLTFTSNVSATPAVAVTPEPSSLVLLGTGLIGGATTLLRRRKLIA